MSPSRYAYVKRVSLMLGRSEMRKDNGNILWKFLALKVETISKSNLSK